MGLLFILFKLLAQRERDFDRSAICARQHDRRDSGDEQIARRPSRAAADDLDIESPASDIGDPAGHIKYILDLQHIQEFEGQRLDRRIKSDPLHGREHRFAQQG